nr:hypothetical protein L204_05032 [Cryptococcus depauperatus CBS 7855]
MSEEPERLLDPAEIRWKMAVACDVCRRRKVRCDGERPCSRCAKSSIECTFSLPKHVSRSRQEPGVSKRKSAASEGKEAKRRGSGGAMGAEGGSAASHSNAKEHLLLIDTDDQLVYSGPSSGMPLFARLGLLRTVEITESDKDEGDFQSHSVTALGLTTALSASTSRDYYDMCLEKCTREMMFSLIGMHFATTVFFPLLHAPSFLAEFVAVTDRQLRCTPQYAALLMSILAMTASLVEGARLKVPEGAKFGETYYEFAKDLLRVSTNKLDIRHILALYHLAVYAEGKGSAGEVSGFVSEALGLGITTGLHRNTAEFLMDPVTAQIRTRLFWALWSLNITLAYSQGRPSLVSLSMCSIEFPAIVDNKLITKTAILPQDTPCVNMEGAVKILEIFIILEQALTLINAPSNTISGKYSLDVRELKRREKLHKAARMFDEVEAKLPSYLKEDRVPKEKEDNIPYLTSCRVRCTLYFARIIIARQFLIDEFEADPSSTSLEPSEATLTAIKLATQCIETYEKLGNLDYLQYCGYHAVSHITAAGHTLIACMTRNSNGATATQRSSLICAIELLRYFVERYPAAAPAARLLKHLSRTMNIGYDLDNESDSEALAIRVLARKMAISPSQDMASLPTTSDENSKETTKKGKRRKESSPAIDSTLETERGAKRKVSVPVSANRPSTSSKLVKMSPAPPLKIYQPSRIPSNLSLSTDLPLPSSSNLLPPFSAPPSAPPSHIHSTPQPAYDSYWPRRPGIDDISSSNLHSATTSSLAMDPSIRRTRVQTSKPLSQPLQISADNSLPKINTTHQLHILQEPNSSCYPSSIHALTHPHSRNSHALPKGQVPPPQSQSQSQLLRDIQHPLNEQLHHLSTSHHVQSQSQEPLSAPPSFEPSTWRVVQGYIPQLTNDLNTSTLAGNTDTGVGTQMGITYSSNRMEDYGENVDPANFENPHSVPFVGEAGGQPQVRGGADGAMGDMNVGLSSSQWAENFSFLNDGLFGAL